MLTWSKAAVALGSNLGDRRGFLESGLAWIGSTPNLRLLARGAIVESPPLRPSPASSASKSAGSLGGPYLNTACVLSTALNPEELLAVLFDIERRHFRDRSTTQRWGPRTLDLDLILFEDRRIDSPMLTIPHPHMHVRDFVLGPLAGIAPEWIVPGKSAKVRDLLDSLIRRSDA